MKRILLCVGILLGILCENVSAQETNTLVTPEDSLKYYSDILEFDFSRFLEKGKRPKIGVALSGGSALGFAHIGVLEAIDSLQIPVDYVAGTSMGSIVGGLYSIGYSPKELYELTTNMNWAEMFTDTPLREYMPFFEKQNSGRYQIELKLKGFTPTIPSGLIQGQKIKLKLSSLTYGYEGVTNFSEFPIPFRCVAGDLISGEEVVISSGSLSKAMRASMSIPTIFSPVSIGDYLLVDGGIINNFPVDVVRNMGADFIVGLNLTYPKKDAEDYESLFDVLDRTTDLPRINKLMKNIRSTDLYIEQYTAGLSLGDFDNDKIPLIIDRGRIAAKANMEKLTALKKALNIITRLNSSGNGKFAQKLQSVAILSNSPSDVAMVKEYLQLNKNKPFNSQRIEEKVEELRATDKYDSIAYSVNHLGSNEVALNINIRNKQQPIIHSVRIEGNEVHSFGFIFEYLDIKPGERFDPVFLEDKISQLYALGYFDTIYYEFGKIFGDSIELIIKVKEHPIRKLFFGIRFDDYYQLVGALGLQITSLGIPGLRTDMELQFAGLQKFSAKVYYPKRSLDIQAYPYVRTVLKNIPLDVFDERGDKLAEYKERSNLFAAGLGIPIGNFWLLEAEYAREYMNITNTVESSNLSIDFPEWKDELVQINLRLQMDLLDNVLHPRYGVLVDIESEISSRRLGSDVGYTRLSVMADWYTTLHQDHTFRFTGGYKIQWRDTPQYKWFSIGGPEDYVGFDYRQTYGSRFLLGRFEYRYAYRKDIFLKAVFNSIFDYNLGSPSTQIVGDPMFGYGVAVEFASIVGPLQVMYARGDKSAFNPGTQRDFIYFTAGYKFN